MQHRRFVSLVAFFAAAASLATAQGPHPLTAAEQAKVDSLVHAMSLQQKIDYIGGTGFAVRGVPSLGLPALEMSDGPYGTRSNAGFPSTTYAAGIGLAASWDRDLAGRVGEGIGRDARREALCSCSVRASISTARRAMEGTSNTSEKIRS